MHSTRTTTNRGPFGPTPVKLITSHAFPNLYTCSLIELGTREISQHKYYATLFTRQKERELSGNWHENSSACVFVLNNRGTNNGTSFVARFWSDDGHCADWGGVFVLWSRTMQNWWFCFYHSHANPALLKLIATLCPLSQFWHVCMDIDTLSMINYRGLYTNLTKFIASQFQFWCVSIL